jgi:serine/threonine protein kinase
VTDFGLSRFKDTDGDKRSMCGTPEYLAPEIIMRQAHGKEVDWWTLGQITYEMIAGSPVFQSSSRKELFEKILFNTPQLPKNVSKVC